ncbi:glycosyltransferase family 4 protein [Candidatus Woesearchaeota archaeon]|nr:glycosyltransferase family 4 protein [Candidatus Woesearchaeota archaeon]
MSRIRLCSVCFGFNHPTAKRLLNFFEYVGKNYDIDIDLITVKKWNGFVLPDIEKYNSKTLRIHFLDTMHFDFRKTHSQHRFLYLHIRSKIRQLNPDVLYIMDEPISLSSFQLTLIAKSLDIKIAFHCWENMEFRHSLPVQLMEKFVIRNTDLIIAGTEEVKKIYLDRGTPNEKIIILPEAGIDTGFYTPVDKPSAIKKKLNKLANLPKEKTILFIGRLMEIKGIRTLLSAAEILDDGKIDYRLIIIGFGGHNEETLAEETIKFSKNHKNVIFIEDLENKYIPQAYNLGSIFVYPSIPSSVWREQFGYSIIEAMSCRLPVISTYSGGPETIIEDAKNGFLIEPDDAKILAKKIMILLKNHELRARMGNYAREYVIKKYSFPAVSKKLYSAFKKLV